MGDVDDASDTAIFTKEEHFRLDYLGGSTAADKNQHWKPMEPMLARYDGWLRGTRQPRWRVTLPYARGSSGHESCEPMGSDVAGDFIFVPYTGASKSAGKRA